MAIASNFPAIKPSLSLDFANTKKLDPRITFTRTTTATYYDGVTTAMAEQNLLLQSQDYSATWTVTNLTPVTGKTAPDSTSTATEFTAGAANAVLTQGYTAVAGSYTFSVWLRRVTGTGNIDIAADNGTWTTKVITGTWARYDVTQTVAAGSKTAGVRVVTSGDAIEVWGAQLEQRSSATAYTATTTQRITNYIPVLLTAASGVARFDHNPTTDESLGLLIEEARTNTCLQSEDFSTTWSATRATLSTNSSVSPAGTLTADKLIATTDNNTHFVAQTFTGTAASWTFTVYAKALDYSFVALRLFNGTSQVGLAYYNLSTGATATVTAGTASIQSVGNGWYRCALTATLAASASCTADIQLANADNTNSFAGNGYSGISIWGSQVELGAFPTSYIATTSATVTRNADTASMTGSNFTSWYNAGQGTLYAEFSVGALNRDARVIWLDGGSASNVIDLTVSSTNKVFLEGLSSGAYSGNLQVGSVATDTAYRTGAVYSSTSTEAVSQSGAIATGSLTLPVSGISQLGIGYQTSPFASAYLNGTIKKISYYPIRVTDANLQALTS